MEDFDDATVVQRWKENAAPWTDAVRESRIESRTLVTNEAIVAAVMSRSPRTVLDIGCGEGWLARELSGRGVKVVGVDVVPDLVARANEAGGGEFHVASYQDLASGRLGLRVDVAVANFSLIGRESVDQLVRAAPSLLEPGGALIVQTIHPPLETGDLPYADGWRRGFWPAAAAGFGEPAPWYFRTLESWIELILGSGMQLLGLREPLYPATGRPASLILVAGPQG